MIETDFVSYVPSQRLFLLPFLQSPRRRLPYYPPVKIIRVPVMLIMPLFPASKRCPHKHSDEGSEPFVGKARGEVGKVAHVVEEDKEADAEEAEWDVRPCGKRRGEIQAEEKESEGWDEV